MNEKITGAVLAALSPGMALSASEIAKRLGLPRPAIVAALAKLASERRVARGLSVDDGFVLEVWAPHVPRQRWPDRLELPIAAE